MTKSLNSTCGKVCSAEVSKRFQYRCAKLTFENVKEETAKEIPSLSGGRYCSRGSLCLQLQRPLLSTAASTSTSTSTLSSTPSSFNSLHSSLGTTYSKLGNNILVSLSFSCRISNLQSSRPISAYLSISDLLSTRSNSHSHS